MRSARLLTIAVSLLALAAPSACDGDEPASRDAGVDVDAQPIDAGDGTCSVDTRFDAPVLVGGLDGRAIESAHVSDDERRVVFAVIDGIDDAGVANTALYEADRATTGDAFGNVRALTTLNTIGEDGPALSTDLLTIYFHSLRGGRELPGHIYRATRASEGAAFGEPVKVDTLDIETYRSSPHLARHASEIWFSAADKSLAYRIYSAKLGADGRTEAPVMARELSISGLDATNAVVSADGRSIYWRASSLDASVSSGGGDIWVATRSSAEGAFESLRPVDELKSPAIDLPASLSRDRCRLYFVSDRSSRRELYVATRAP